MSDYALPGFFPPLHNYFEPSKPLMRDPYVDAIESGEFKYSCDISMIPLVSVKSARLDPVRFISSLTFQKPKRSSKKRRCSDTSLEESPEFAMDFELSSDWNGKDVHVVRSLGAIRQLRRDLMRACDVPQLPELQNNSLGFTLMKDALSDFSPKLEKWFRDVAIDMADTRAWTEFWEPDIAAQINPSVDSLLPRRKSSLGELDSIEESETEADEEPCE